EQIEVLADPLRRDRLWDHDVAELKMPAEDRLCRGLSMGSGDTGDRVVVQHGTLCERAPGLGCDSVLLVPGAQLALLHLRMELDLVDRRASLSLGFEPAEVVYPKV